MIDQTIEKLAHTQREREIKNENNQHFRFDQILLQ